MNPTRKCLAHWCLIALFATAGTSACDPKDKTPPPAPSATVATSPAASTSPLPPLKIQHFSGLGLKFDYPEPYVADKATTNPEVHQVALDHNKEPGVVTIRFNPQKPGEQLVLNEVAEATRQRMGTQATVENSKLEVAGKTYEARTVKASQLGLVGTIDVVAIVPLGDTNYVVLTHVSEGDQARAQRLFDTVLGSLARE